MKEEHIVWFWPWTYMQGLGKQKQVKRDHCMMFSERTPGHMFLAPVIWNVPELSWIRRKQISPPVAAATVAGLEGKASEDQTLLTSEDVSSLRMWQMPWNTEYYLCRVNTGSVLLCDSEILPKALCEVWSEEQGMHVSVCAVVEMSEEIGMSWQMLACPESIWRVSCCKKCLENI